MIKPYIKNGKTYYYFVAYLGVDPTTDKQIRTTRRGFRTEREAKLAEARLLNEFNSDTYKRKQTENLIFKDVFNEWLESYRLTVKESTLNSQLYAIKLHIEPLFFHLKIEKITVAYCQKQINHWYSYYSKFGNLISIVSRVFDFAINNNYIKSNPMKKIVRPKKKAKTKNTTCLNKEELQHFLSCVASENNDKQILIFRTLAFCGLRRGELLALKRSDLDFTNSNLDIKRTLARGLNDKTIIQTPKTADSLRTISVDNNTMQLYKTFTQNMADDTFIFTDIFGEPHDLDYINRILNRLIKKYNLKKMTVHDFRHTHCSLLFESGATLKAVQERLGHADIKTTMDIYAHVTKNTHHTTAQNFANYIDF